MSLISRKKSAAARISDPALVYQTKSLEEKAAKQHAVELY